MKRFLMTVIPAGLLLAGMGGGPPADAPPAPLVALDWLRPVKLAVVETDSGATVTFTARDSASLAAVRAYLKEMEAAASPTAVDMVCGMTVNRAAAEAKGLTAIHKGRNYFFCSAACRSDFLRRPARFARP
ncbi:MAG: hypothetical protein ABIK37_00445 [candidate division WOR-3 bacterium]